MMEDKRIDVLIQFLETTTDEFTLSQAAASLGEIATGNDRAISALVKLLESSTKEYNRRQVAYSLGKIDPGNESAISALVRILETSTDEYTRKEAADSLIEIATGDKKTISALVKLLETATDQDIRRQVASSLVEIAIGGNESAISALVRILETTTDEGTRRQAAYILGEIAKGDEGAISALIKLLETATDEFTRRRAAESLGQIATGDERAISELVKLLETTTDEDTRSQAAESLGQIAKGDEKAISELVRILETTKNKDTRDKALNSLGQIARDNTTAIKALIKLLSTSSSIRPIVKTLEKIASPGNSIALEGLRKLLPDIESALTRRLVKELIQKLDDRQKQELEQDEDNLLLFLTTTRIKETADRYFSVNSYQKRKFCYQRILACLDKMQQGRDILTRRSLMQSYLELYQQIVAFSLQFKEYKDTFIYIELFRNRYLVERIAQQDAPLPQTISPALARKVQTAKQTERKTLQTYTDAISKHRQETENNRSETELETLSQAWENAKQTLEDLYLQVAEIEPEFIAKTKVYPIHFEEVQQLLPADNAIIEFFFTETELITLLILPGTQSPLIPETLRIKLKPNHLETLAEDWKAYLEDKNKSETNTTDTTIQQLPQRIDHLGKLLNFTDLNQYIPRQIKQLIIVPNNYLHLFPIHALPWNENQRLIDCFSVRYFPNLHIWKICQNRQRTRDSFLGIENPTADKDLIFAKAEIGSICQTGNFKKTKVLPHDKAKKQDILQDAKNFHCFHFSGHGEYNFTNPLESYLELSETHSENLTLSTIFTDLHLPNADLATLSACCTGVVDAFQPTDECLGIATGFLLAGAKAVVSSLWKVNSIATAFLLDEFYRQLEQTQDKAVALQNAQNWLRKREAEELIQRAKEWDLSKLKWEDRSPLRATLKSLKDIPFENPYYWAPFILTGC
ncbi:HEAT repeat domain-containing protein [Planktothricoides raciborskii]|uniref:CHAT domain-containing protein n=1 Tax=Planktothricoides raciborskii FACHB-1370 TaxID=2949576 RepID=A0ABR8E9B4_9CYAN|nr:CHAT domain-containing protein [Planktothricoides raciborskii]MBD2543424.1 CHAT domain-containing protein [Planktothricoides raciborskii FACHB-1370]MBD2581723.1 CHAT domain-containing protein [Planktothricoides raciborskii FACHB-1261]